VADQADLARAARETRTTLWSALQATQLVELDREVATGLRKLEDEDLSTDKQDQEEEQTKDTETIGNACENMTTEIPDEKKD
jgi:hypothetical protein